MSAADGSAVESNENLTIQGDGALYAEGKGESYDGILANRLLTIDDATLTASGGKDGVFSEEGVVSIDTDKTSGLSRPSIHYYPVVSDPVEEPTEVESPKTFDGGIALQIAMTALALTGSAWLMKKD